MSIPLDGKIQFEKLLMKICWFTMNLMSDLLDRRINKFRIIRDGKSTIINFFFNFLPGSLSKLITLNLRQNIHDWVTSISTPKSIHTDDADSFMFIAAFIIPT